jgi:HEAT repeat protein
LKAQHWVRTTVLATAIGAGLPSLALAQTAPGTPADAPLVLTDAIQQEIQQLSQTLNDPVSSQAQRDEAARRLVERQSDSATAVLRRVLADANNPRGQTSVALALADFPTEDVSFIAPLASLLGPDARLTSAAAMALAGYKYNARALKALGDFAHLSPVGVEGKQREASRIGVLNALGTLPDKRAAAILVDLLRSDLESPAVHNAAADALATLSSQPALGHDAARWLQWWDKASQQTDFDFRTAMLTARAAHADRADRRKESLSGRLQGVLNEQYLATARDQKPAVMARYLADEDPTVRVFGAELVVEEARNANPPTSATREQLRSMIGDSDAAVRTEVAATLRAVNDQEALDALCVQLSQESDTAAKIAQINALGTFGRPRAVRALLPLTDDASDLIAVAAIRALGQIAPALKQGDPGLMAQVRDRLVQILKGPAAKAGEESLRAATIYSLAPLADASFTPMFLQMLNPREATQVRIATLHAIATVGDPNAADRVAEMFDPQTERDVRLAAVKTIGSVGRFEFASPLLRRMDPAEEPDAEIRATAAASLKQILPSGSKRGLKELADQFRQDPVQRLNVLKVLVDKLAKDNDPDLAFEQQNLGEVQMNPQVGLYHDAAASFKGALEYWKTKDQPASVTEILNVQYLKALLKSGQFAEATTFAAQIIGDDQANAQTVFQVVSAESEELRKRDDFSGALRVIAPFKDLKLGQYNAKLLAMESDIQSQLAKRTTTKPTGNARGPRERNWAGEILGALA